MFARKDLERDVLSAYQRHSRNMKKASSQVKPSDAQQPRTLPVDTARHAEDAEGDMPAMQSPTSDFDSSYTYAKADRPMAEGHTGNSEEQQVKKETDHEPKAVAEETDAVQD